MSLLVHEEHIEDVTIVKPSVMIFYGEAILFHHLITTLNKLRRKIVLDMTQIYPNNLTETYIREIIWSIKVTQKIRMVAFEENMIKHLRQHEITKLVEIFPDPNSAMKDF